MRTCCDVILQDVIYKRYKVLYVELKTSKYLNPIIYQQNVSTISACDLVCSF